MGHAIRNLESPDRVSRLEGLPPDLHAVLALLLRQRKTYAEIAGMLGIEERAVHDRAHAALAMLDPRGARELTAAQREQVGEYLLDQAGPAGRSETLASLRSSSSARGWAQALAAELAPLAAKPLPEIPAGGPAAEHAPPAATPTARSSRTGGIVVLGVIAAVVVAAVVLIVGVGGSGSGGSHPSATTTPSSSTATTSSTASTTTAAAGEPKVDATLPLTSPNPAASKALGVAEVVSRGSVLAFLMVAEHLPPTSGFRYAAWLYNSPSEALPLGSTTVGSNGILKAAGGLPTNAGSYHKILLTEEHSEKPTHPGPIVLSGAFKVG
jgi:Sigma-70, region 4